MATATSTPEHKVPPETVRPVTNILDIPNEILIKIIFCLNARERVALGNSCGRFRDLVFKEKELLMNLDFSEDGSMTKASDIQQYFYRKNACSQILAVNIRDTGCMKPGRMLENSIGKAINLVDINVHGIEFLDVWQLASFLNPLKYVQRLSFDWPQTDEASISTCCKFLQQPFSRLQYLSVEMKYRKCAKLFIHILGLCQELRKLRLVILESQGRSFGNENWGGEHRELKNLQVMEYCGPWATEMKERFRVLLPKNNKWADFQLNSDECKGFYLEIVDVCQELIDSNWIERNSSVTARYHCNFGWALVPELLLKEVLRISHEDVPEEFCCLSSPTYNNRCLLKIDELKALLKNPRSQISYLYLDHPVSLGCDIHLIASAYENLTELVLASPLTRQMGSPMDSHFQRRSRRRGDASDKLDESLNLDSSFKMLVENSPRLRHFTLGTTGSNSSAWDLDELHLISKWKFLETLRLLDVPIKDGKFLVEVGKQCENLRTLRLTMKNDENWCYKEEFLQMLSQCKNLRDFSITGIVADTIHDFFRILFNSPQLRRFHTKTFTTNHFGWYYYGREIERLIRWCPNLTTFLIECPYMENTDYRIKLLDVESFKNTHKCQHLRIQINLWSTDPYSGRDYIRETIVSTREKQTYPKPFPNMWTAN